MKVKATLKNLRISPRKVRVSADLIRGQHVDEAIFRLKTVIKRSNKDVLKLLESAVANAENNFSLKRENLFVSDIQVGEGATMKRWMPRAYGRASQILKRTSHVYIVLEKDDVEKYDARKDTKKVLDKKKKSSSRKSTGSKKVEEK